MPTLSTNIVIGGAAGQGLATIGLILTKALARAGYFVLVTQSYESRIRGGHNTYSIRASSEEVLAPTESIDILLALDEQTVQIHSHELRHGGFIIIDASSTVSNPGMLRVPFKDLAAAKFVNVAALGVLGNLLGLGLQPLESALSDFFAGHGGAVIQQNRETLLKSYDWAANQNVVRPNLAKPLSPSPRLTINGNEAIAFGALSAGLKFFSFYPMTPATSVGLTLAQHASAMGIIVEQAEDEIAAINMAIGASFTGALSMVATSGGGFALMTEAVSLAGMTETPIVIVVAQRPGPSTGLPTRTEQADLEFVLHAGHGEFPRAIFAPGTVEDCFHLARKAFEVAEESRGPVFLLTDQFLADSFRAVLPFPLKNCPTIRDLSVFSASGSVFLPYEITASGASPTCYPGLEITSGSSQSLPPLAAADSDEHTEDGHLTEDLTIRRLMVEKRLRKLEIIKEQVSPPEFSGGNSPEILLVCWGSTRGSALEAASMLEKTGKSAAVIHFSQLWPLVPEQFIHLLEEAGQVISVESNATGQFANLIRRETGFQISKRILRYDGLAITPEFILRAI